MAGAQLSKILGLAREPRPAAYVRYAVLHSIDAIRVNQEIISDFEERGPKPDARRSLRECRHFKGRSYLALPNTRDAENCDRPALPYSRAQFDLIACRASKSDDRPAKNDFRVLLCSSNARYNALAAKGYLDDEREQQNSNVAMIWPRARLEQAVAAIIGA